MDTVGHVVSLLPNALRPEALNTKSCFLTDRWGLAAIKTFDSFEVISQSLIIKR